MADTQQALIVEPFTSVSQLCEDLMDPDVEVRITVIELTEDRPNMWYEAKHRGVEIEANRRWVSEWESTDG